MPSATFFGRFLSLHGTQPGSDGLRFLAEHLFALLRVDRLAYFRCNFELASGYNGENVAVEMRCTDDSMDRLACSATTRDWRTHEGMVLPSYPANRSRPPALRPSAPPVRTNTLAALWPSRTRTAIPRDIPNLAATPAVSTGDTVAAGAVIGFAALLKAGEARTCTSPSISRAVPPTRQSISTECSTHTEHPRRTPGRSPAGVFFTLPAAPRRRKTCRAALPACAGVDKSAPASLHPCGTPVQIR